MTRELSGGILRPGIAIPTEFQGTTYRSRLEANVARFLCDMGLRFEYEKQSFLINGGHYCPDFYLPDADSFVEARGYVTETSEGQLEEFARQRGELFVFYSDRAEHIRFHEKIYRNRFEVAICGVGHAGLATLGHPCWYCSKNDRLEYPLNVCSLEVEMRSSMPTLVTEFGQRQLVNA